MSTRDQIIEQVLALSPEDRAIVAEALRQGLPHDDFATNEVAVARCQEIERRLATYKRGDEPAMEHPEAYEYFRQTLAEMPAKLCHAVVELLRQRLSPEELRHAWGRELERRVAEMDRGEVETLDAEESIAELRRHLAARRAGKTSP
jgi:hypothetical protein